MDSKIGETSEKVEIGSREEVAGNAAMSALVIEIDLCLKRISEEKAKSAKKINDFRLARHQLQLHRFESTYREMELQEAENSKNRAIEDILDAIDSSMSMSSGVSDPEDLLPEKRDEKEATNFLSLILDEQSVKVEIPSFVGDLVLTSTPTRGITSFTQVRSEPVLSESVVFLERLLNVLADYGKLFLRRRFRFEFGKLLLAWKLLIPEKLETVVAEFVTLANDLFEEFSVERQNAYMGFMRRFEFFGKMTLSWFVEAPMWGQIDAIYLDSRLSELVDESQLHINAKKRSLLSVYDNDYYHDPELNNIVNGLSQKQLLNPLIEDQPMLDTTVYEDEGIDSIDLFLEQQRLERMGNVDKFGPADPGVILPAEFRYNHPPPGLPSSVSWRDNPGGGRFVSLINVMVSNLQNMLILLVGYVYNMTIGS